MTETANGPQYQLEKRQRLALDRSLRAYSPLPPPPTCPIGCQPSALTRPDPPFGRAFWPRIICPLSPAQQALEPRRSSHNRVEDCEDEE